MVRCSTIGMPLGALGDAVDAAPYKGRPAGRPLRQAAQRAGRAGRPRAGPRRVASSRSVPRSASWSVGSPARSPRPTRSSLAGYLVVADFSVPHASFFLPPSRSKARDPSCALGAAVVPRSEVGTLDALTLRTFVDGALVADASTADQLRPAARLLADVSDFMTLASGRRPAHRARAGRAARRRGCAGRDRDRRRRPARDPARGATGRERTMRRARVAYAARSTRRRRPAATG